ncbi:rhomboid family intramembrane serine protease [Planctomicrobium sp. SH661]|uniref:rhomboid family intramembrane serine protease n=1 Tax=Planctomicrobium sp. SH661 TaxID=3448124 RepID=UPI003F5BAEB0
MKRFCPSCHRPLQSNAKICVDCGIDLSTGRSIRITHGFDKKRVYSTTRDILNVASWFAPIGVFPIRSEAYATREPFAAWAIVVTIIVFSTLFWTGSSSPRVQRSLKQAMLWCGTEPPSSELIEALYEYTDRGNLEAYDAELGRLEALMPETDHEELAQQALANLPVHERVIGEFRVYQLLSHAFLHGDIVHLAGNMIVLLILGSKINGVTGNVAYLLLFAFFSITSGLVEYVSLIGEPSIACLGASGVAMGMAGMYLILFPVQRVHVVAWIRPAVLLMKIFSCPGMVIVLFYIVFDVIAVAFSWNDSTAHWAHLGGFITGIVVGLALLLGRQVDSHGADILSVFMGRGAWEWIGTPSERAESSILSKWP